jgi:flagellar hook-associated protein 1 FlgK
VTSPFFGLNIGASALRTAQMQVDIANQNIANANTPGYSRQAAKVSATAPFPTPAFNAGGNPGQLGTGVQITEVNRARDTFLDAQMRTQLNAQGQADARSEALSQVEAVVNEPSTTGLSSMLSKYWSSWQEVANSPAESAIRSNLIEQGKALADVFQGQVTQFAQQQRDLDQQVGLTVTSVNTLASQIAAINKQVSQVEVSGMHANDLRDQRDQLVDALSKLVKINTVESSDGAININVGNHQLVERSTAHTMVANTTVGAFTQVQWTGTTSGILTGTSAAQNIPAAGMTLTINNVAVVLPAGRTPAETVVAINTTAGLGSGGAVIASLNSGGALVLTSTIPGSTGSVNVSATPGSIATILGMVTTSVSGTGDGPVIVGGGKLQGLIESRDQLLKERIDGVNALASRVIESVNSVSATGVGLDGIGGRNFFSGTNASDIAVDSQLLAAGGSDKVAAGRMYADAASATGYSSAPGDSSNAVAMAQLSNLVSSRASVPGELTPGALGTTPPTTLIGLDLSGAAANTTYTFSVSGAPPTLMVTPPGIGAASITVGKDSVTGGNSIYTIDTGSVRLTLSIPITTPAATLAQVLAGLAGTSISTNSGPSTMGDQYARQIASLGVESQTARSQSVNQGVLINQLDTQRQSVSGVSLDEETINLITYQKAYQAAARIVTVMDEMLDTLINNTGRVGR